MSASSEPTTPPADDGLAWPRDFGARTAEGLDLAVVLGGGGLYLLAWYVAYLQELKEHHGIDLRKNDRIVGTSAGSVMAAGLTGGKLGRMHLVIGTLEKQPGIIAKLAPAGDPTPAQARAREMFWYLPDAQPETIRSVGHAALAAPTQSADTTARTMTLLLGMRKWPGANLHTTCMDTFTGERIIVTEAAGVSPGRATAASSAVPGIFSPQPIGDRKCMDGGVSDSGTHADLAAGARKAVVLSLPELDIAMPDGRTPVADTEAELAELAATGTEVFHRTPESADAEALMDPAAVPVAFAMGTRQAAADAEELRAFLA